MEGGRRRRRNFPKGEPRGRAVDHVFWLTPGHASEPGVWYAGTSPKGLFRSEDGGVTWAPVSGFNDHPEQQKWVGSDKDETPDGGKLHSILVDPRDAKHLYLSMSGGGTFESTDRGASWTPLNLGVDMDFAPPKTDGTEYEFGHDPHCVIQHPANPDRLWMQNHCGIYRIDRPSERWVRVGKQHAEGHRRHRLRHRLASAGRRTPRGCSRWTAPRTGRARRPAAGRRCT